MTQLRPWLGAAVLAGLFALVAGGQDQSVRPGINDPFKNPDLPKYLKTFEGESREIYIQRDAIVKACGLKPGMVVADVGAGTGLFTRLFAREVGSTGKVYAVDIAEKFLDHIRQTCKEAGITNVETVRAKADSVELPAGSIDVVFVCDTYHHFEFPYRTLATIHKALKPNGRLVIIDFERIPGKSSTFVLYHVRAGRDVFTREIVDSGFRPDGEEKLLKENYFVRFRKVAPPATPPMPRLPFDAERARTLRAEWAQAFSLEPELTNSVGMKLMLIPGGRFDMGPNGSWHRVTIAKPYYLGQTEVTLGQYRKWKPGHRIEGAEEPFNADDRPVALVSWNDARAYCDWLTDQPGEKRAGRVYTLPTEAQWEWAARAGTATRRHVGDADKGLAEYAWFNVTYTPNPKTEAGDRGRQPAGRLKPNAWGLHDMLGNVWEWCADRRVDEATGETRDPTMRGGSWRSGGSHCTSVAHDPGDPNLRADNIGFRVACRVVSEK